MGSIFLGGTDEVRVHSLSRKEEMECYLRHVGDPGFQINVGEKMSVAQGTCSETNCP